MTEADNNEAVVAPRLVTAKHGAELLGISVRKVRGLIRDGAIPIVRIGRVVRLDVADLVTYVARNRCVVSAPEAAPKGE